MTQTARRGTERAPLSRERILKAAVALADERGLEALTMRNLAESLGVEAMSLYYHVANKEALLDGVVEVILDEILDAAGSVSAPLPEEDWKTAMRSRILAAREVMLRHKWAPPVFETRTSMNPPLLHYYHGLLEIWRRAGFSYDLAHHGLHVLGSRALGFTQELFEPDAGSDDDQANDEMMSQLAEQLPYLVEMLSEITHEGPDSTLGWCDDQTEFEFGLDLTLDGLDRLRESV
jgi:AcrR family transcriptional regulator